MIPTPEFTSFNVESALPPLPQPNPSSPLEKNLPQSATVTQNNDLNRYEVGEFLHKSSNSSVVPHATDRWVSTSTYSEPKAVDAASSDQQHAVLSLRDGHTVSITGSSIKTVCFSTPGSHRTSNTSNRDIENEKSQSRPKQQSDDSFYWHSGRSSSETEEDQDQSGSPTATPEGDSEGHTNLFSRTNLPTTSMGLQREPYDLPIRSTSLSPTTSATYGASALGFGGPSDWEYFGDYEAEEIDDEELYSRPRPQNSSKSLRASSELSVNSPLDLAQPLSESHLPDSDIIPLGAQHLYETTSPTNLKVRLSKEDVVQESKVSLEGQYDIEAKLQLANDLVTHGPASCKPIPSSNTCGQQRPDLDDVIRAWSEAPYIGKVYEKVPATTDRPENDREPAGVAEASLASTPRECMLGVDVVLENTPLLPKSLNPVDSLNHNEQESQCNTNVSTAQLNVTDQAPQEQPLSKQQEPLGKDVSAIAKILSKNGIECNSENENAIQRTLPSADVVLSGLALSSSIDSSLQKMSLDSNGSLDRHTELRTHDSTRASEEQMQRDAGQRSQDSSYDHKSELGQRMVQKIVQGNSNSKKLEDRKETNSKPQQIFGGNISHDGTTVASSETTERLLRPHSPSRHLAASPTSIPRTTLKMNTHAEKVVKPRQDPIQENEKTSIPDGTSILSPLEQDATDAVAQANPSPPASAGSLPYHVASSEIGNAQDPYSDLDPWGKASLNRFAAMLREESRAETNQDKLNIFNVFTGRESRLRVILYGTDDELIIPQKPTRRQETVQKPEKVGFVKQAVDRANSIGLDRSLKALPALPAHRESVLDLPVNAAASLIKQRDSRSKDGGVHQEPRLSGDDSNLQEESETDIGPSADDSYIMIDSTSNGVQCSPGGKPVIVTAFKKDQGTNVGSAYNEDNDASSETLGDSRSVRSASSNRPIAGPLEDAKIPETSAHPLLKHNKARSEVKNYLANRKSVCRPYATLTQGSLDCVSTFGKEERMRFAEAVGISTAPTSQYSSFSRVNIDGVTNKQRDHDVEVPNDLRRFINADFDPLLLALPSSDAVIHVSPRMLDLRNVMEAIPDDFGFIHQSVVAWDAKIKRQREENDRRRHARQAESEQKIDSLFDDHEIGYGDIAELETEFKRSEAARRADEDRFEYQTFVSNVFDLVWTRLHYELDQLIPHYDQYSKLMDDTLAGKEMFENSEEGLALGPTMSSFLALHQKIEIRHQKAFEAVLERDRRLKKTEISPWYALSSIAKVKQLEKQFEDAEKKAIIEYCQLRNARANHLMDVLDQNTLRGVGANQDYMEAIMKAVRRIASGRAFASVPGTNEPTAGLEEVEKARAITALLASSSEQVVQTFHVADMLLNSADYEVHVAKAKVAKADMTTLANLKEERAKEDQKLMRDLEHRLALIREDTRRTNDEIVKLMLFLGVHNGRADTAPVQAEDTAPKHKARI